MSINIGIKPVVSDGLVLLFNAASLDNYILNEIEVLVVAGGGGGSHNQYDDGAGGGGGGVLYSSSYIVTAGSAIVVTVGNGGAYGGFGDIGQNSIFGNLISQGGGGGGGHRGGAYSGGSGGGSGGQYSNDTNPPGNGVVGQGHRGGQSSTYAGGGGGGAGAPGTGAYQYQQGGNGGDGLPFDISGKLTYYGGGGGGFPKTNYNGLGGKGGGGDTQVLGNPNTGGGGGGGKSTGNTAKAGGSGIVIVRYPGPQKATGGNTITNVGGYTIHTFTASGTFTPLAAPANGGAIYDLQDLSGNNNTGTQSGGVTYSTANGGALNFDGSNDYVTLSKVLTNSGNLTYCAWVYRSVVSPDGYTNLFTSTTQNEQFQLDLTGYPGGFGVYLNGAYNSNTSNLISLNTWVYICWQRNGTGLYGYLNGVEQFNPSTGNALGNPTVSTAVSNIDKIGAYSGGTYYNLNGKLGPVHMYNRALTAAEVLQNYNATKGRFGL